MIFPVSQYAAKGETAPAGPAMLITLVYFIFVPALAFRQRTEVLYDGTQIALRFLISGFLIFTAAYWLTPAETLYNSTPQLFAFMGVCTALYATVVLGVIWAIQFARKGTSGIDTEFQ